MYEKLIAKLEANYVGFHLRKTDIEKTYTERKLKYKTIAGNTKPEDCSKLMQEFLSFFGDGHLFVVEYPKFTEADIVKTKEEIKI
ncbi:MAG: hypothetical protein HC867_07045 [Bacteroidia bacterium]|nr:hypothetical protein [Bacteroidia bacterium]